LAEPGEADGNLFSNSAPKKPNPITTSVFTKT